VECSTAAQYAYAIALYELRANRNTDFTEKFFVRVDVTEEFPFLVTKLSPYFDR
jgi:hypothetical protein